MAGSEVSATGARRRATDSTSSSLSDAPSTITVSIMALPSRVSGSCPHAGLRALQGFLQTGGEHRDVAGDARRVIAGERDDLETRQHAGPVQLRPTLRRVLHPQERRASGVGSRDVAADRSVKPRMVMASAAWCLVVAVRRPPP